MARKILLIAIRLFVSLNLLGAAILFKLAGVPYSIALFTKMSNAVHGLISQPTFRIGSGIIEIVLALLFLIPATARFAAVLISLWMVGAILSHIFVLGYGIFFVDALLIFALPCLYLYLTRAQPGEMASGSV
jgi:uncharacterized membrane protein YphA (DoxX/SURF4 family)